MRSFERRVVSGMCLIDDAIIKSSASFRNIENCLDHPKNYVFFFGKIKALNIVIDDT
jgi:hypothetical protein